MRYCQDTVHWNSHAAHSASDRFATQASPVLPIVAVRSVEPGELLKGGVRRWGTTEDSRSTLRLSSVTHFLSDVRHDDQSSGAGKKMVGKNMMECPVTYSRQFAFIRGSKCVLHR